MGFIILFFLQIMWVRLYEFTKRWRFYTKWVKLVIDIKNTLTGDPILKSALLARQQNTQIMDWVLEITVLLVVVAIF